MGTNVSFDQRTMLMVAGIAFGAAERHTGPGAIFPDTAVTRLTSTEADQVVTLADGATQGQRKRIILDNSGGSIVLTPAHLSRLSTITFTNARDWVELEWDGAAWAVIGYSGVTFA